MSEREKMREQLYRLLKQRPFQPFRVCLKDGRGFDIRYPNINLLGQALFNIGHPESDGPDPLYDYMHIVTISEIAGVEMLPVSTGAASTS